MISLFPGKAADGEIGNREFYFPGLASRRGKVGAGLRKPSLFSFHSTRAARASSQSVVCCNCRLIV